MKEESNVTEYVQAFKNKKNRTSQSNDESFSIY